MQQEPPTLGHSHAIDVIQAEIEGQCLYEMFVRHTATFQGYVGVTTVDLPQWKTLPAEVRTEWCELAMDFIKVAS